MDINSLLSPEDAPATSTPPPGKGSPSNRKRARSNAAASTSISSPLRQAQQAPPVLPRNAVAQAQQEIVSPPITSSSTGRSMSTVSTPSIEVRGSARQPSTPGMDTLADLASMQHHQQTARANASGLRSTEVFDAQLSPSGLSPALQTAPRTQRLVRSISDLANTETPVQTPPPRTFTATSLSESDLETIAHLVSYLAENPYAHDCHVQLINLLHRGFISHIHSFSSAGSRRDPHTYDLLDDLRQAREAMNSRFSVCEDLWSDWISDEELLASDISERVAVMELCEKAVTEEFSSTKLWRMYGEWMWRLYKVTHDINELTEDSGLEQEPAPPDTSWSEEDKAVGKEVFGWGTMIDVWARGAKATEGRLNDSHLVWDRYAELLLRDLESERSQAKIEQLKALFVSRLQTAHATWDMTFQSFSTFVSTFEPPDAYETTMVQTSTRSAKAKQAYSLREDFELKLQKAQEVGDKNSEWNTVWRYLEWEVAQLRKKKDSNLALCIALYERAVIRFPSDANLWEDYVFTLLDKARNQGRYLAMPLPVLARATRHCPWSGTLWSQYLLTAEMEIRPHSEIEEIKHAATRTGLLDIGGMEEMLKVSTAWCSLLRRRAFHNDATDEDLDVAEVGIVSALEEVKMLGERKYGNEYTGDPLSRVERIYIKFLTQCGQSREKDARDLWRSLISLRGNNYEFWQRYYMWEMVIWGREAALSRARNGSTDKSMFSPREATAVLKQAIGRPDLDWPEKLLELYIQHCENHEDVEELQLAVLKVRHVTRAVKKRRDGEALQAAAAAQAQQPQVPSDTISFEESPGTAKRKRESEPDVLDPTSYKKIKSDQSETLQHLGNDKSASAASTLKRDRENATVIIKNLPVSATETRVRQFFRDCGTINSLKLLREDHGNSATATIEFDSKEDVLSAQTRDMKTFDGNSIEVHVGRGSTIFVTNFPPIADETYIRDLFKDFGEIIDVRFPSLQGNTHRRFCYVQFKSSSDAQAATTLDGKPVDEKRKLVAKISDPSRKKNRSGALHEGRELHIANLDRAATEADLERSFDQYGTVESVRIPKNMAGKSKGFAFVVFRSKEEANAALDANLSQIKSRKVQVTLSVANPAKRQATTIIDFSERSSTSPSPDTVESNGINRPSSTPPTPQESALNSAKVTKEEIRSRTIALMNVPDTVNDARIRHLVECYGPLKKVVLRPDHQGAIIEFDDAKAAGNAALGLERRELVPGRPIHTGTLPEMMKHGAEKKHDRITVGKENKAALNKITPSMSVSMPIKRPNQPGAKRGGRGGLGIMREGVGLRGPRGRDGAGNEKDGKIKEGEAKVDDMTEGTEAPKSNADFKAMFLNR
ncbi:MAG: Splicing factor [Candelina submexicana]|nr:MAG: Splicing factor [Candelina submexicana]